MLKPLKDLLDAVLSGPRADAPVDEPHAARLAAAVLLVEVMRAEPGLGDAERRAVVAALRSQFGLDAAEVERLVEHAVDTSRDATDYYEFTSRINAHFDEAQKIRIIEQMWRVAYADGRLGAYENHIMRKVADLLYIPQGAYVNAKMRARAAMGGSESPP